MNNFIIALLAVFLLSCEHVTTYQDIIDGQKNDTLKTQLLLDGRMIYTEEFWSKYDSRVTCVLSILDLKTNTQREIKSFQNSIIYYLCMPSDSNMLFYYKNDFNTNTSMIVKVNIDSANFSDETVIKKDSLLSGMFPCFTHDNKLAYVSYGNKNRLFVDGVEMTLDREISRSKIAFTRDGKYLIYSSNEDSVHESLYSYDLSSHISTVLVKSDVSYERYTTTLLSVSPDIKTINFQTDYYKNSVVGGNFIIGSISPSGESIKTHIPHYGIWSPDGKKIAYSKINGLYVSNIDGSNELKINGKYIKWLIWVK